MKRLRLPATLALVALAAATAISVSGAAAATNNAAAVKAVACGKTATIGYLGPTTGPAASIGEELRNWALLAVDQWNAKAQDKPKIKVVEGDTQFDPAQASTIAQEFASKSQILAVSGPGASQNVLAVSPIFKKAGFGYVSASATNAGLTNGKNPGFFRVVPSDSKQATTTTTYMTKDLHAKHVFLVDDQTTYSQGLADAVQNLLKAKGVGTTRTSVSQNQTDYSSVVTDIPSNTDLVYLALSLPAKMQLFGEQMQQAGLNIPLYVSDTGYSPDLHINGTHFSTFAPDIRNFSADKAIVAQYFKRFGKKAPLTTYGPPSYVATQVVIQAVARACKNGSATRAEVRQQIAKTHMKTSILGSPISFLQNGERRGARFTIFVIRNGKDITIG
jgi:branched-chain amino acid transport system substrate-binding protein